ncbi:ABC transporter ATP-binding protein [Brevibacillus laterosporus]|uniref:ABC transporter ATP-binding protein n=1 Tax=Brevibacillus laterosporus TaxID=1465 RepID=UPI000367343B|nr:ABC transporter ATP-binding protein [Brevibacillus laterosporus]ATO49235.1 ABC transporter [Brevibacillus laterosporus DSM 25]MBG9803520.1 ABC transporter [Brevibacillus laterosporus]MED2003458.1 ABC transporter ATP-binding protein [Brevibacillus laterosporus]MED4763074.1 ABC transporter ATP-binding protein [Brevibacillus laterosporus]TPH19746.1 ABC transporter ATP-binding protein [Brevibacillus laterosporus]
MSALETKGLTLQYGDSIIIENLGLCIPKGEITVLIGSNGCGKSTLLRSLARLLKPSTGHILLNGKAIAEQTTKEIAKQMAILPQGPIAPEGLTVLQLVKQGRYPHQNWLKQWTAEDEEKVAFALEVTQLTELAHRPIDSLSGGQRQRAWIALTLAQDTDIILLDEPTTYLDMTHQIEVLDILFELNQTRASTIVMVLHDLNLACRYAHHLIAVQNKQIYAQGSPETVLTERMVEHVFRMQSKIISDPLYGTPMCIPVGNGRMLLQPTQGEILQAQRRAT